MIVYQTDHQGFFVGPVAADPSPLEPGIWLIPGGAVEIAPPPLNDGEQARWTDSGWEIVPPTEPEVPIDPPQINPPLINRIERRQGLRALLTLNIKRADVESMINGIEDEIEREIALAEYEHMYWLIDSPFIVAGANHFNLTAEQVQQLFDLAATL
jgi:hypothetical protein